MIGASKFEFGVAFASYPRSHWENNRFCGFCISLEHVLTIDDDLRSNGWHQIFALNFVWLDYLDLTQYKSDNRMWKGKNIVDAYELWDLTKKELWIYVFDANNRLTVHLYWCGKMRLYGLSLFSLLPRVHMLLLVENMSPYPKSGANLYEWIFSSR